MTEKLRKCFICGNEYPKTRKFFYDSTKPMSEGGKRHWSSWCMQCASMYQILYYRKKRLNLKVRGDRSWHDDFENKFESKEQLKDYLNHEKIECLLCGKEYEALNFHILFKHKMPLEEYRKIFGIPMTKGLVGTKLRAKRRAHGKTKNREFLWEMGAKAQIERKKHPECEKGREYVPISKKSIVKNARKGGETTEITREKIEAFCHVCQKPLIYTKHGFKTLEGRGLRSICYKCAWKRKNQKAALKKKKLFKEKK